MPGDIPNPFPRCDLYDIHIVDRFPGLCIFNAENPVEANRKVQDEAERAMADPDNRMAIWKFRRSEICFHCFRQKSNHPLFVAIRLLKKANP